MRSHSAQQQNGTIRVKHIHIAGPDLGQFHQILSMIRLSAATYWYPSTAMVCAERTYERLNEKNETVEDCVRNKISRDGAHWCVENMGARYSASVACLLGCVHNGSGPSADDLQDVEMVRRCEQSCNDRFMSILPVEEEWIESQKMALFSKSV
mmetsp:Transcript_14719/g.26619  ORF Transcript_14719/g.26619 Transcript_14719/m.26619 type:complete len:153 (-) Transcript_14719:87-545(-)